MKKCCLCKCARFKDIGIIETLHPSYSSKSSLWRCLNCGLFWIDPIPDKLKLSKIYSGVYHYNPNKIKEFVTSLYSSFELRSDYNLVKDYKKKGKVLDIGAGRGDFLLKFPADKWEKWVYDPFLSSSDTELVRRKIGLRVNNYNDLKKYPNDSFDLIILRNVIEHTSEFMKLLRSVSKLLKKGGILFIRTPNMDSLDFRFFKTKWYVIKMVGHIVFFNKESLSQALRRVGLKAKYVKATSRSTPASLLRSAKLSLPFPIAVVVSVMYSFFSQVLGEGGDLRAISQK